LKLSPNVRPNPRLRFAAGPVAALVALLSVGLLLLATSAQAATQVPLGAADSFAVLAGAGITNTGPTTLNGDLGTFPTTSISGSSSLTVTGTNHGGDSVTQGAKTALVNAYNVAAGQGPTSPIAADLGGRTLVPGVYNSASSIGLTGALTLDAGGDPNAVFVFQAGSALTTASASLVNLVNGAQSCNVFWQVGSSATLGTGSNFRGTILALTDITVTTGATVEGRVLARNGAVTLDTNTITRSACSGLVASPSPSASASATPTARPSTSPRPSTSARPATATGSGTTTGTTGGTGTPNGQVVRVPTGAVAAGDGSTSGGGGDARYLLSGGVLLAGLAGGTILAVRRRNA
jgi:hypothetical protein